jgi:hypothetical protein
MSSERTVPVADRFALWELYFNRGGSSSFEVWMDAEGIEPSERDHLRARYVSQFLAERA